MFTRISAFTERFSPVPLSPQRYTSFEDGYDDELDNLKPIDCKDGATSIPGWPTKPMRLQPASVVDRLGAAWLILLPLPFVALILAALSLHNQPQSNAGERVLSAMRLGPTVFPLVFAAVAGTTLRTIALWKAEHGTTVGTLERLLGSHTFVQAIQNALILHSMSFLTVGLISLWLLSPIGGQASLRLMYETNSTKTAGNISTWYTQPDLTIPYIRNASSGDWADSLPQFAIDHIVSASLTVSQAWKENDIDPWGRPKIAALNGIRELAMNGSSSGEWVEIAQGIDTTYASLVGIGLPALSMETLPEGELLDVVAPFEYMDSTCNVDSVVQIEDLQAHMHSYGKLAPFRRNVTNPLQVFGSPRPDRNGNIVMADFFLSAVSPDGNATKRSDGALLAWGLHGIGGVHVYHCSLRKIRVDAAIRCQAQTCSAKALRLSDSTDSSACTISSQSACYGDLAQPFSLPLRRFLEFFPTAMTGINENNCPIFEYMYGYPVQQARNALTPVDQRDWSNISEDVLSSRLTTLINTFWYAWLWNDEVYTLSSNQSEDNRYHQVTAARSQVRIIYKLNLAWAFALCVSALVLVILSVINAYILFRIKGPDLFGYVSVLLRDDLEPELPTTGSVLHGSEMARLLNEKHVQLVDVQPLQKVGKIALRAMDSPPGARQELDRLRLYR